MRINSIHLAIAIVVALMIAMPVWAGEEEPTRYFGPGPGYPDFGSAKYFTDYYPPEDWSIYGYGTGSLGMGYGPYIYGGRSTSPVVDSTWEPAPKYVKADLKWIGGNEVRVTAPSQQGLVTQLRIDVLAFNGMVINSVTVDYPPFEARIALPEGAVNVRVYMDLSDGFTSTVIPIKPI